MLPLNSLVYTLKSPSTQWQIKSSLRTLYSQNLWQYNEIMELLVWCFFLKPTAYQTWLNTINLCRGFQINFLSHISTVKIIAQNMHLIIDSLRYLFIVVVIPSLSTAHCLLASMIIVPLLNPQHLLYLFDIAASMHYSQDHIWLSIFQLYVVSPYGFAWTNYPDGLLIGHVCTLVV